MHMHMHKQHQRMLVLLLQPTLVAALALELAPAQEPVQMPRALSRRMAVLPSQCPTFGPSEWSSSKCRRPSSSEEVVRRRRRRRRAGFKPPRKRRLAAHGCRSLLHALYRRPGAVTVRRWHWRLATSVPARRLTLTGADYVSRLARAATRRAPPAPALGARSRTDLRKL